MEIKEKEVTLEELAKLIQTQEGEFIIRVKPREGDAYADAGTVSA